MSRITMDFLRTHDACWLDTPEGRARAEMVFGHGPPLVEMLAGPKLTHAEKIWLITRQHDDPSLCGLSALALWKWLARLVERALASVPTPDHRSLAVVPLLRRLAAGEDVPSAERTEIVWASWAAWAEAAARAARAVGSAAWATLAARAARVADRAAWATLAAARAALASDRAISAAEERRQIADAVDLLGRLR